MQIQITLDTLNPKDVQQLALLASALGSPFGFQISKATTTSENSLSGSTSETSSDLSTQSSEKAKTTRTRKPKAEEAGTSSVDSGEDVAVQSAEETAAVTEGTEQNVVATETAAQDPVADAPAEGGQKLTLEFMRAQFTAKGRADKSKVPLIRQLLKDYGVSDLSGLDKDKYAEAYAKLERL